MAVLFQSAEYPLGGALLRSAAAVAPCGLRVKLKLPTQATSNAHPPGV